MTEITHTEETVARLTKVAEEYEERAQRFTVYHRDITAGGRDSAWDDRAFEEGQIASDIRSLLAPRQDQAAKTSGGVTPDPVETMGPLPLEDISAYLDGWLGKNELRVGPNMLAWALESLLLKYEALASPVLDVEDQGSSLEGLPRAKAHAPTLSQDGWVLVPREITLNMQHAYFDVIDDNLHRVETDATFGRYCSQEQAYRAMLSAAPQPPESGWRTDMEKAPRTGEAFHVWSAGFEWPEVVRWQDYGPEEATEVGEPGYWTYAEELMANVTDSCGQEDWTHWMPLPPPPQLPEGKV